MKSPITSTTAANVPLVIPTQTRQSNARLVLRNDHGQIVQQWLLRQNKCTLGSASGCAIRCALPGIAPYHALLVIGARQTFIRALAPKLTREGRALNEILLTDGNGRFEIAGHAFELVRKFEAAEGGEDPGKQVERLKFTLARPFELSRTRIVSPEASAPRGVAPLTTVGLRSTREIAAQVPVNPKWMAQVVQAAMEPLQSQLSHALEPLTKLQWEADQNRLRRKKAARKKNSGTSPSQSLSEHDLVHPSSVGHALSPEFEAILIKQAAALDVLGERVADVNYQLSAIERLVADERPAPAIDDPTQKISAELELHRESIEQLQSGIVSVSSVLQNLQTHQSVSQGQDQQWRQEMQDRLSGLTVSLDRINDRVADVQNISNAVPALAQQLATVSAFAEQLASLSAQLSTAPETQFDLRPAKERHQPIPDEGWSAMPDSAPEAHSAQATEWAEIPQPQVTPLEEYACPDPAADWPQNLPTHAPEAYLSETEEKPLPAWWTQEDTEANASSAEAFPTNDDNIAGFALGDADADAAELWGVPFPTSQAGEGYATTDPAVEDESHEFFGLIDPQAEFPGDVQYEEEFLGTSAKHVDLPHDVGIETLDEVALQHQSSHAVQAEQLETANAPGDIAELEISELVTEPDELDTLEQLEHSEPWRNAAEAEGRLDANLGEPIDEADEGEGEEDSVEDYMRKLLARMRGVPEDQVEMPVTASAKPVAPDAPARSNETVKTKDNGFSSQAPPTVDFAGANTEQAAIQATEPFDPDKYLPRVFAPEKTQHLAAMRELANSSARTAINKSTRQRHLTSVILKVGIAVAGFAVGTVLIVINGFALNIGLIATVASFFVALIWGYDAMSSLRPLLHAGIVLQPQPAAEEPSEIA